MNEARVRIMLVDDHKLVVIGLRTLLGTVQGFSVVGEAGSVAEAVAEARRCRPDVVIMDLRLPDGSGVEACRDIRSELPSTRVLMLTSYEDSDAVVGAITAGAAGYLLKQTDPERLIEAVDIVASGGSLLDSSVTESVLEWMRAQAARGSAAQDDPLALLSEQERRILPLVAQGKTNREIASELQLSESTVKTYISYVLQKLHMARRAEIAAFASRQQPGGDSAGPAAR
jgi:DNA-binding NarL/FixJ family response regulator